MSSIRILGKVYTDLHVRKEEKSAKVWKAFPPLGLKPRGFHGLKPNCCETCPPESAAMAGHVIGGLRPSATSPGAFRSCKNARLSVYGTMVGKVEASSGSGQTARSVLGGQHAASTPRSWKRRVCGRCHPCAHAQAAPGRHPPHCLAPGHPLPLATRPGIDYVYARSRRPRHEDRPLDEAQTHLRALLEAMEATGEPVRICRQDLPVAGLTPHRLRSSRTPRPVRQQMRLDDDPTAPLTSDEWPESSR